MDMVQRPGNNLPAETLRNNHVPILLSGNTGAPLHETACQSPA